MTGSASLQLESRSCTVTVGAVSISNIGAAAGLDIWFQVKRSLKPNQPNTCQLRIRNLSPTTRAAIAASTTGTVAALTTKGSAKTASKTKASASATVPVTVTAGYVGGTSVLFAGQLRSAQTSKDGADDVTELTTGDGDEAALVARSTGSYGKGSNAYLVALAVINDMGIGPGNIQSFKSQLQSGPMFAQGVVLKGNSLDRLVAIAWGCGLEVTIQQGVLQWTKLGMPVGQTAYVLSTNPNTGVIGSPTIDTKGVLSVQTLLLPGLKPGLPIQVSSTYLPQALYRIISIETTGDTAGDDWGHAIEAKPNLLGVG